MFFKRIIWILSVILTAFLLFGCQQNDVLGGDCTDNTEILANPSAPVAGDPDLGAVSGYTALDIDGFELPYIVPDTTVEVLSVGSYSGGYFEDKSGDSCADIPAVVVRNTSDKVISYCALKARYGDTEEAETAFVITNLPAGCCAVVLCQDKELSVEGVNRLELAKSSLIMSDSLNLICGTVGVKYEDGAFVVTNLTDRSIGEVYIRYKYISAGNVYLGGATFSVNTEALGARRTVKVFTGFDPDDCVIIAVESTK